MTSRVHCSDVMSADGGRTISTTMSFVVMPKTHTGISCSIKCRNKMSAGVSAVNGRAVPSPTKKNMRAADGVVFCPNFRSGYPSCATCALQPTPLNAVVPNLCACVLVCVGVFVCVGVLPAAARTLTEAEHVNALLATNTACIRSKCWSSFESHFDCRVGEDLVTKQQAGTGAVRTLFRTAGVPLP